MRDDSRGVARVLHDLTPDVVLLQEAPRLLFWRLSRRRLARRAGLLPVTRTRSCGVAVLRRPAVTALDAWSAELPHHPGLHRRAVAVGTVSLSGHHLTVASTHLDLEAAARLDSATRVRALLPDGPLVLACDVNEQPGGPAWAALGERLVEASAGLGPTFPARAPHRRIDGLWVSPDLIVEHVEVVQAGTVSDHLPILVDLRQP
ncbi:MAG: endonuclease/exonuclease/phosphatase [Frankiales bacterium]|nr:endonuclease/exonuclease/phosphatase [Frankiales bacterium]